MVERQGKIKTNISVSTVKMIEIEENMHVKVISASIPAFVKELL